MSSIISTRRLFLAGLSSTVGGLCPSCWGDELPRVLKPRATDGDSRHEPNWEERLTLTVGNKTGDLIGNHDKVLQAAVNYVSGLGGGTVKLLPGKFVLRNAVFLPSGIRIIGSGEETVITKEASRRVDLASDSDWYDQEITLKDAKGFKVGDGICLEAMNPNHNGKIVMKRTIVAKSGSRLKLNDGLRENLWISGKPSCISLFPLFTSERTADVRIENITFDGNKANNENFNGNHGGCIFLQDCNRYVIKNVTTRNYNGDGISFQICHDVTVEDCHSHDNADLGVHPGSGSQRPLLRNNRLERNTQGIFWCWGVKYGLAEGNRISGNRSYGISIGHCDTDNVIRDNVIVDSGKVGLLFRNDARGIDFWANRNLVERNRIINSGGQDGVAIDITGQTKDLRILGNTIVESREASSRVGIRIGQDVGRIQMSENDIQGFMHSVQDLRSNRRKES